MKLAKTYGYLKKDLTKIEKALNESIQAEHPVLRNASTQLLQAGGKRIRPIFVILSGKFGQFDIERIKTVAVTLELIHMATLVHDDVVDEAELRRGKDTVKKKHGNRIAMYTGDYILARALEHITEINHPDIHKTLSKALVEVCIGEIEQIQDKYDYEQNVRNYFRRIKRKTALLIATSCQLGALASGASTREANLLYRYGYYIGMSYQIIDDILDFTSSAKQLGKPTGNDLLQGNITLPVLFAMKDHSFSEHLKQMFSEERTIEEAEMDTLIDKLKETDAIEQSYAISDRFLEKSLKALEQLSDNQSKRTLIEIAHTIGKRKR